MPRRRWLWIGLALCLGLIGFEAGHPTAPESFALALETHGLGEAPGGPIGLFSFTGWTGWTRFVALVFVASMLSEDLTCIGVGLLVGRGAVGMVGGTIACLIALVAESLWGAWIGQRRRLA